MPVDPEARGLVVVFGFLAIVSGQTGGAAWPFAVAVMGFIVQHDDVLEARQFRHDAFQHVAFGFGGVELAVPAFQQRAADPGHVHFLAAFEGVVVGDDDFGAAEVGQHVGRHQLAGAVIAVGVVGFQNAQPVLDGDAGGDDQEASAEPASVGMADGVDGVPGDEHGHDGGFAAAGRHFHRHP